MMRCIAGKRKDIDISDDVRSFLQLFGIDVDFISLDDDCGMIHFQSEGNILSNEQIDIAQEFAPDFVDILERALISCLDRGWDEFDAYIKSWSLERTLAA